MRLAGGCTEGYIEGTVELPEVATWRFKVTTGKVPSGGDPEDSIFITIDDTPVGEQTADEHLVLPLSVVGGQRFKYRFDFKSSTRRRMGRP